MRSRSSGSLLLVVLALLATAACGSSVPRATEPPPAEGGIRRVKRHRAAIAVLDRLAGAMRNDRADRLVDVADPVHGLRFWGQPGVCAAPLFRVSDHEQGTLTGLARARMGSAPPHFTDRNGYWSEVAETIRAGLRVVKVNAGNYELPPEEELERASAWASLDTRRVALGQRELGCLGDDVGAAGKAPRAEYRYRFRAERGYSSVTVFLVEHEGELRVAHVILVWHYDA
ncbi:MAG TPA: hypothetical protein VK698_05185 [Kofleriaceae bacterium]|nr:hypothetical protein [Kofleriaceae bacterium]